MIRQKVLKGCNQKLVENSILDLFKTEGAILLGRIKDVHNLDDQDNQI